MTMTHHTSHSSKDNFVKSILPENWQQQFDANFSSDDLIDAYFKGKNEGQSQYQKIILEKFKENINKATGLAEKFIGLAKERGVNITNAHLKIDGIVTFTILFVVKEEDFLSDNFRNIYSLSNGFKTANNSDEFSISITFTYQSEFLNSECLSADGFIMRYADKGKA